jgi:hypothetical protein
LSADWYCQHYGSGDGTKPWEIEDTIAISNKNGPVLIPLIFNRKTFCPYVVTGIFISLGLKNKLDNSLKKRTEIYLWSENDLDKRPTPNAIDTIALICEKSDEEFKFIGDKLLSLGLPTNIGDTLRLQVLIANIKGRGAGK